MRLFLIRHGIAEPGADGMPDETRALTRRGRKRARRALRGLQRIARLDEVVSSPLLRARETACLVADIFDLAPPELADELAPGADPLPLLARLAVRPADARVALVGHLPDLGQLAGLLAFGDRSSEVPLGRAGVARLDGEPYDGGCRLAWVLAPGLLRALGRGEPR